MTLSADLTVDASAASLGRLVGIARLAGAEILRWYGGTGVVEFKGDGSPLTVADRAANDLVVPTDGVFAENGSGFFPIEEKFVFGRSDTVAHTGYFANRGAREGGEVRVSGAARRFKRC